MAASGHMQACLLHAFSHLDWGLEGREKQRGQGRSVSSGEQKDMLGIDALGHRIRCTSKTARWVRGCSFPADASALERPRLLATAFISYYKIQAWQPQSLQQWSSQHTDAPTLTAGLYVHLLHDHMAGLAIARFCNLSPYGGSHDSSAPRSLHSPPQLT